MLGWPAGQLHKFSSMAWFNCLEETGATICSRTLSLVFDSILRRGALSTEPSLAFDSCQQLTSYKVKWSIAEAGRLDEKVMTGHSGQVLTRTMSQQSTPRPMSKVQKKKKRRQTKGWQHSKVGQVATALLQARTVK